MPFERISTIDLSPEVKRMLRYCQDEQHVIPAFYPCVADLPEELAFRLLVEVYVVRPDCPTYFLRGIYPRWTGFKYAKAIAKAIREGKFCDGRA